jgi:Tat protein translocase TatB subunit
LFLFIFESIGTSELLLIGIVALIFLGPRKLPQMARTLGKMMAEFRRTTDEFKSTWEREVNFEENDAAAPNPAPLPVARVSAADVDDVQVPEIRELDSGEFNKIRAEDAEPAITEVEHPATDKKNWF